MLRFPCPHCHAGLKAKTEKAGAIFFCPQCKQKVRVPVTTSEKGVSTRAEVTYDDTPMRLVGKPGLGKPLPGLLITVAALSLFLVVALVVIIVLLISPREPTVRKEVAQRPEDVQPLPPFPAINPIPEPAFPVQPKIPVVPPALPIVPPGQNNAGGPYLVQSITRATNLAAVAKNIDGYGYNNDISILAAWVGAGASVTFNYPLIANVDYMFLGAGDDDARIIDLEIFDNFNNRRVALDQTNHPEAIVRFTPQFTGRYLLTLTLIGSRDNLPCICSVVILKRDGWTVPFKNLDDATLALSRLVGDLNQTEGPKLGKRFEFRYQPNQWAVYGGVLNQGSELVITNVDLGFGDRIFAGVSDGVSRRLDLQLLDVLSNVIAQPRGLPTNMPFLVQRVIGPGYGFRLRNASSPLGASLVMLAVLDVH